MSELDAVSGLTEVLIYTDGVLPAGIRAPVAGAQ